MACMPPPRRRMVSALLTMLLAHDVNALKCSNASLRCKSKGDSRICWCTHKPPHSSLPKSFASAAASDAEYSLQPRHAPQPQLIPRVVRQTHEPPHSSLPKSLASDAASDAEYSLQPRQAAQQPQRIPRVMRQTHEPPYPSLPNSPASDAASDAEYSQQSRQTAQQPQRIPRVMRQTHEPPYSSLPKSLASAAASWIKLNPDWSYEYFDGASRRRYIAKYGWHFAGFAAAYERATSGAMRADLWRYPHMYTRRACATQEVMYRGPLRCCNINLADSISLLHADHSTGSTTKSCRF